jgi:hypothetical protein
MRRGTFFGVPQCRFVPSLSRGGTSISPIECPAQPDSWVWIERTFLTLLDIALRDFADDFDDDEPLAEDALRQEVEAYIQAHDARGRADKVYITAPPDTL